jgi:uncharacterized protein (TIGR02588 family)
MADEKTAPQTSGGGISLLEQIVSIIGALLVGGIILYLVMNALTGNHTPPNIYIEQRAMLPVENGYLIEVMVVNKGGETAANLEIEATLLEGDGETVVETSEVTIDYVAAESHNPIGLFFTHDPRQYTLELRAVGYEVP